jgi:hypothetical protein
LRFAGYWFVYHFVLWNTLFMYHFLQYKVDVLDGGPMQTFGALYADFCQKYYPMLLAAFAVLPLLLYDSVRTTHRIAGPLVRFRQTLRQLRQGEYVKAVKLRDNDLLIEFQQEFNEFLDYYNARLGSGPAPAAATEETLLRDVQNLSAHVESPRQVDRAASEVVDTVNA